MLRRICRALCHHPKRPIGACRHFSTLPIGLKEADCKFDVLGCTLEKFDLILSHHLYGGMHILFFQVCGETEYSGPSGALIPLEVGQDSVVMWGAIPLGCGARIAR